MADRVLGGEGVEMRRCRRLAPFVLESSAFAGFRFPPEVILLAVRWYLRFGLSSRALLRWAMTTPGDDTVGCTDLMVVWSPRFRAQGSRASGSRRK